VKRTDHLARSPGGSGVNAISAKVYRYLENRADGEMVSADQF
jgi:hypothetical protein